MPNVGLNEPLHPKRKFDVCPNNEMLKLGGVDAKLNVEPHSFIILTELFENVPAD